MDNLQVVGAPAILRGGKSKITRTDKKMKIHKNHPRTKAIKTVNTNDATKPLPHLVLNNP